MKNTITIFRREINAYFNSAIAYIFIVVFLFISAGLFMTQFFLIRAADMRYFFFSLPIILCVFIPAVTMRLWAEDRRGNTLELLLTFPMQTHELVLGKFLASLAFYTTALLSTLTIPIMLLILGKPDLGAIFSQYLGCILTGSFFIALGLFISGFCKDQIVSFILAMVACFSLFLLGTDFMVTSIDGWFPGFGSFLRSSIAMTQHFDTFQKGVIDLRDILYFLTGTIIFLVLNSFWLESRLRPRAKSVFATASAISLGIFVILNFIISDTPIGRFDLTEGRIYTISRATKEILDTLKAPVTIKLFVSPQEKMPSGMKTLERDVRDKLDEFKVASKGKFNYKIFHMEAANVTPGAEDEESLEKSIQKKGISPFQVQSIEADEVGVKLIYSALSIAYKERPEEVIPRLMPQNLFDLEYTIISKIYRMTLDKAPSVALLAPYVERAIDPQTRQLLQMFGQGGMDKMRDDKFEMIPKALMYEGYNISRIKLTREEPIPVNADTLLVMEPERLNDRQRFEINRFLVNGGSVLLAVQRYNFDFQPFGGGISVNAMDLKPEINKLTEKWGLGVSRSFLMDTEMEILSLTSGKMFGVIPISQPVKMPMQIRVMPDEMNKKVSITSHLASLFYLWGSALEINEERLKELNLKTEHLFSSSQNSWEVPFHQGNITRQDMTPPSTDLRKSRTLATLVTGEFPDAFEGEDVPFWPEDKERADQARAEALSKGEDAEEVFAPPKEEKHLSPKPGKLILIGCSQMFTRDLFGRGGHMALLMNSVDALTLGDKLIRVRSKAPADRSMKKLSRGGKAWWRIFTVVLIPSLLCAVGGFRIFLRKRMKWQYLKTVKT